jgi:uncharacterized protein (TIGR02597 family)
MNTRSTLRSPLCALTALLALGFGFQAQAQSVTTTPVGARTFTFTGDGTSARKFFYVSVPFLPQPSIASSVSSIAAKTIYLNNNLLVNNEFGSAESKYYLEIISGPSQGLMSDVVSNTTNSITVADEISSLQAGEKFVVRKHRTISDVFGQNNEANMGAATTPGAADQILVFNASTQVFSSYFYSSNVNFPGWRSTSAQPAASVILYPEDGVLLSIRSSNTVKLVSVGEVRTCDSRALIQEGFNMLSVMSPVRSDDPVQQGNDTPMEPIRLSTSGLYTGSSLTGVQAGSNPNNSDRIFVFNPTTQTFSTYFYSTNPSFPGWRRTDASDASGVPIESGSAVYLYRRPTNGEFMWKLPRPYTL